MGGYGKRHGKKFMAKPFRPFLVSVIIRQEVVGREG